MNFRWLNPKTNAPLYAALLGLAYTAWQAELAASATGPLTWTRAGHIAAGVVFAAAASWVRGKVTPLADPRDGNGNELKNYNKWAAGNFRSALDRSQALKGSGVITDAEMYINEHHAHNPGRGLWLDADQVRELAGCADPECQSSEPVPPTPPPPEGPK